MFIAKYPRVSFHTLNLILFNIVQTHIRENMVLKVIIIIVASYIILFFFSYKIKLYHTTLNSPKSKMN
jgi:hypothetical protein